jgi:MoaA/NifB/PqqE/SkfB family radical SAM enzyme
MAKLGDNYFNEPTQVFNGHLVPISGMDDMPVFYNWEIHYSCNYRCTYCPFTVAGWHTFSDKNVYPGLPRLTEVWTRMHELYGKGHIAISGGEPATYPSFIPLIRMLTGMHSVELNTNLSFNAEKFAAEVDLRRVRLAATFHPQFVDFDTFFRRAVFFREKGLDIFVNYVSYPDQLEEMWRYKREFKAAGMAFHIMPYNGVHQGRVFPQDATEREKALVDAAVNNMDPEAWINRQRRDWPGHSSKYFPEGNPSETARRERQAAKEKPQWDEAAPPPAAPAAAPSGAEAHEAHAAGHGKRKAVLCRMGQKYCKIRPNGEVYRCCAWLPGNTDLAKPIFLGNFFKDDDFRLLPEPAWCDYDPCPCERCMVVGEEVRWKDRWVTTT